MHAVPVIFNRIQCTAQQYVLLIIYGKPLIQVYLLADHLCQIADNNIYQIKTGQL